MVAWLERVWDYAGVDPAPPTPDIVQCLAAVKDIEVHEAPAWWPFLQEAVQHGEALRVYMIVGFVCLAHPAFAEALLTPTFLQACTEAASYEEAACAFAHMLSDVASQPSLRPAIAGHADVQTWIEAHTTLSHIETALCTDLVLIKLAITSDPSSSEPLSLPAATCDQIYDALRDYLLDHTSIDANRAPLQFQRRTIVQMDALESLYYLVSLPAFREKLSSDTKLLQALRALLSSSIKKAVFPARDGEAVASTYDEHTYMRGPLSSSATFVLVSILSVMVAYLPPRSTQERQVEALRRSALKQSQSDDVRLQPPAVEQRCRRLIEVGLVPPLVSLCTPTLSSSLRPLLCDLFLALTTEQDAQLRGLLLQQGASKALLLLSQSTWPLLTNDTTLPAKALAPMQALAKLCISTDPTLIFGMDGTMMRAATYLSTLLLTPIASLLQLFEGALALTNLASVSPAMATAVARTTCPLSEWKDVSQAMIPLFLQHDSVMIRRALVELLCNLAQDSEVFAFWSGEQDPDEDDNASSTLRLHTASGRLRLLVSLCHLSDDPHQVALAKASAGLLATLSSSVSACDKLSQMPPASLAPLADLLTSSLSSMQDTQDLALRVLSVLSNLCAYAEWLGESTTQRQHIRALLAQAGLVAAVGHYLQTQAPLHDATQPLREEALALGVDLLKRLSS